ncbi:MAG: HEPN domain-containing protein [Egibacteraceae bacterium]
MSEPPDTPLDRRWLVLARAIFEPHRRSWRIKTKCCASLRSSLSRRRRKLSKGAVAAHDLVVPKTHKLSLLAAMLPSFPADLDVRDLECLEPWVVDERYPADLAEVSRAEAEEAVEAAERVLGVAECVLSHLATH